MPPVNHIPCTHIVQAWQHSIEATLSELTDPQPCLNIRHHDRTISTRKFCLGCSGPHFFTRRGGIAERGIGSRPTTSKEPQKALNSEDADDSGYHSDVIHEEDELSDIGEIEIEWPLSPKATELPRLRVQWTEQRGRKRTASIVSRLSSRKQSWKSNLKEDPDDDDNRYSSETGVHRDSIVLIMSKFGDSKWYEERVRMVAQQKKEEGSIMTMRDGAESLVVGGFDPSTRRSSTLLHPSSPGTEETVSRQTVQTFLFPNVVHIRKPSGTRTPSPALPVQFTSPFGKGTRSTIEEPTWLAVERDASPSTTRSTPSPKSQRPPLRPRKSSSLLHPSLPATPAVPLTARPTILSVPPRGQQTSSEKNISTPPRRDTAPASTSSYNQTQPTSTSFPHIQMPIYPQRASTEPTPSQTRSRKASILHSSLSDMEDENDERGVRSVAYNEKEQSPRSGHTGPYTDTDTRSLAAHDAEHADVALLARSARFARKVRGRRWGV